MGVCGCDSSEGNGLPGTTGFLTGFLARNSGRTSGTGGSSLDGGCEDEGGGVGSTFEKRDLPLPGVLGMSVASMLPAGLSGQWSWSIHARSVRMVLRRGERPQRKGEGHSGATMEPLVKPRNVGEVGEVGRAKPGGQRSKARTGSGARQWAGVWCRSAVVPQRSAAS